jgi:hypothetical protein
VVLFRAPTTHLISHNPFLSTKPGVHSPYTFPDPTVPAFLKLRHFPRSLKTGNQWETTAGNLHQFIMSLSVALSPFCIFPHFLMNSHRSFFFFRDVSTSTAGIIQCVPKLAFRGYIHFPRQGNIFFYNRIPSRGDQLEDTESVQSIVHRLHCCQLLQIRN